MRIRILCVLLALLLGGSSASAAIVRVTYTGTVSFGYDQTGVFGAPDAYLTGESYTVSYVFDTTRGFVHASPTQNYTNGGDIETDGGVFIGNPSEGVIVTIGGHSAGIGGLFYSEIDGSNNGTSSEQFDYAEDYNWRTGGADNYAEDYITNSTATLPATITGPLNYTVVPGDNTFGYVEFGNFDTSTGVLTQYTYASMRMSSLTIFVIPELSTWTMVFLGFAGLGLLAYRAPQKRAIA